MSRFGGHGVTIGSGKASDSLLPEDQSVDHLLDHYAKEIIPNYFYISSYDAIPEYMGMIDWKQFKNKPIKLCVLEHSFTDLLLQYDVPVTTSIYLKTHEYDNVFALFIKTHQEDLKDIVSDYFESYDYVLQVFIRSKEQDHHLNTTKLERILLLLFYKMGLIYEGHITSFKKSKTHLGKLISKDFESTIISTLNNVDTDAKISALLNNL
jgi:hypothetical protein